MASGEIAFVSVERHSLEVEILSRSANLQTRFGLLRVRLPGSLSATVMAAVVGMPLPSLVGHPMLDRKDWRVEAIEVEQTHFTFVSRIGSLPHRLPLVGLTPSW